MSDLSGRNLRIQGDSLIFVKVRKGYLRPRCKMVWSRVPFSCAETLCGAHHSLVSEAARSLMAVGSPKDATVFGTTFPETGEVELLFSPAASQLLSGLLIGRSQIPCERPSKEDVRLVVGPEAAWSLLD